MSRHLALVGPTATGKSTLALAAAAELDDVEIVSIDSMQVYRGMDIGTAKPTAADREAVPHHLLDVADPGDEFSVTRFQEAAGAAIAGIEARGYRALLVGGTGLYYQAVVDGLTPPGRDDALHERLDARAEESLSDLYAELTRVDPVAAGRMEPTNRRRVVRALEVTLATGRPFSSFGPGMFAPAPGLDVRAVGLWLSRDVTGAR
ncbi:MAG: tRNA (adenosine(37)-N6)-dimethylallyltransferase MiaA, partial [Acidimicrobiia bacterium]